MAVPVPDVPDSRTDREELADVVEDSLGLCSPHGVARGGGGVVSHLSDTRDNDCVPGAVPKEDAARLEGAAASATAVSSSHASGSISSVVMRRRLIMR